MRPNVPLDLAGVASCALPACRRGRDATSGHRAAGALPRLFAPELRAPWLQGQRKRSGREEILGELDLHDHRAEHLEPFEGGRRGLGVPELVSRRACWCLGCCGRSISQSERRSSGAPDPLSWPHSTNLPVRPCRMAVAYARVGPRSTSTDGDGPPASSSTGTSAGWSAWATRRTPISPLATALLTACSDSPS